MNQYFICVQLIKDILAKRAHTYTKMFNRFPLYDTARAPLTLVHASSGDTFQPPQPPLLALYDERRQYSFPALYSPLSRSAARLTAPNFEDGIDLPAVPQVSDFNPACAELEQGFFRVVYLHGYWTALHIADLTPPLFIHLDYISRRERIFMLSSFWVGFQDGLLE